MLTGGTVAPSGPGERSESVPGAGGGAPAAPPPTRPARACRRAAAPGAARTRPAPPVRDADSSPNPALLRGTVPALAGGALSPLRVRFLSFSLTVHQAGVTSIP